MQQYPTQEQAHTEPATLPDLRRTAQQRAADARASIIATQERLQQIELACRDYEDVTSMLAALPDKQSHDIMVPLGKAAFFPGKLINTDKCQIRVSKSLVRLMFCSVPNYVRCVS
jgi:prefoldin subunit 5